MKKILVLVSLFTLSMSSGALASSKICYGSTKSDDTKGVVMTAQIDSQKITLKTTTTKGDFNYNGTYPVRSSTVQGRDGKFYLEYKGENSDYQDVIMVDKDLLQNKSTGLIQIRARGEGFFNLVFFCKDASQ